MTAYTLPEPARDFLCTKCGGSDCRPEQLDKTRPECGNCGYLMFTFPRKYLLEEMQAAYEAGLRAAPEGYRLVPIVPTPEMCRALFVNLCNADNEALVIKAVIAAAPEYLKCSL